MRYLRKNVGFVLVELIVVTVILGAIFPLSIYFIDAMKAARETKIQQTANYLAQKYMEEYKQMDLEELAVFLEEAVNEEGEICFEEKINKRDFFIKAVVKEFFVPVQIDGWLGDVKIVFQDNMYQVSLLGNQGGDSGPSEADLDDFFAAECILEIDEGKITFTVPGGESSDVFKTANFDFSEDASVEPRLNLHIENVSGLTLNVENKLAEKLLINKIEKAADKFSLKVKAGQVEVHDDQYVEGYRRGVNIIVTVEDQEQGGNLLAEVAQTRFIEWVDSIK